MDDKIDLTFEEVVIAYLDCRRRKRRTIYALNFEYEMESNLFALYEELKAGTYEIGQSMAFVVEQPKVREIWAATFRDRVVHHVIYNRLAPRFYPSFISNTYACIPDRGTLDASDGIWKGMRSITQNWNKDAYFLGADIRNFFVSINKDILHGILIKKIHEPWLLKLTNQVLYHDPRSNCHIKSKKEAFDRVPRHKSLWFIPDNCGLPIGNLTSQFFANVYLNELDQYVKHQLRVPYYYRYVDDFVFLDESHERLNWIFKEVEVFLENRLNLELHPFKKRIGKVDQGIDFVGYFHKPYRRYTRKRTVNRMKSVVDQWRKSPSPYSHHSLWGLRASVNSYFGMIRQSSSFNVRKDLGDKLKCEFMWPDPKYNKILFTNLKRSSYKKLTD